jgi:plastocyanin
MVTRTHSGRAAGKVARARRGRRAVVAASAAALAAFTLGARSAPAADACDWLGERLPLPLAVESAEDIAFKTAAERQYLIFNLMAGGKTAWQRGDAARAVEKWDALLRIPDLDPQVQRAVAPLLAEARKKLGGRGGSVAPGGGRAPTAAATVLPPVTPLPPIEDPGLMPVPVPRPLPSRTTVSGVIAGGGEIGPGSSVVWLKRLDGPMPRPSPRRKVITQREKTFLPRVLAVPVGSTVDFQNDDRVYHNVFSIAKPNDFDGGIRAAGSTYSRTFERAGAVEILCNIHATMKAFVYVVDSPYYTTTRPTGSFTIRGVPPGRYELSAWNEASSTVARRQIAVAPGGLTGVSVTVGGDRRPGPFVPDKYGHKRQAHFGY